MKITYLYSYTYIYYKKHLYHNTPGTLSYSFPVSNISFSQLTLSLNYFLLSIISFHQLSHSLNYLSLSICLFLVLFLLLPSHLYISLSSLSLCLLSFRIRFLALFLALHRWGRGLLILNLKVGGKIRKLQRSASTNLNVYFILTYI